MTHLSPTQMSSLLERAKFVDKTGRLHLMILLGWRHGLRASEICTLRVGDFDLQGACNDNVDLPDSYSRGRNGNSNRNSASAVGYLTVARLKGSLRTTQPLFPDELAILPSLLRGKGPTEFVFPGRKPGTAFSYAGFYDRFRELCHDLAFPEHLGHPHVLKHTTGMTVIKQGIENCRQYLGHRSIASTGAYLKVSDAEASKAAFAAFA